MEELRCEGLDDVTVVQVPYGIAHLDCMFGLVDKAPPYPLAQGKEALLSRKENFYRK